MVQKLHVMAPPNVFTLASFQLILKSFPSLQELVVDLPEDQLREFAWGHKKKDCITIGKVLDALSIPCCISDRKTRMFLSPTVDLIKRRAVTSEIEDVILYTKFLQRDLSTMFGLPRDGEITTGVCLLSKLSGTARDLEACLKKVYSLCIWREAADKEVLEEEVEAVNVVLNLLADENKSGLLRIAEIPRVLLLYCMDWTERLGGTGEVERHLYYGSYYRDDVSPYATIIRYSNGNVELRKTKFIDLDGGVCPHCRSCAFGLMP